MFVQDLFNQKVLMAQSFQTNVIQIAYSYTNVK
jgi:hypothetical protein